MQSSDSWIKILGNPSPENTSEVASRVAGRIAQKKFAQTDVDYIKRIDRSLIRTLSTGNETSLSIGEERLQKLRRLCQLWEVDLKVGEITSHRKYIGPLIVGLKKLLVPVIRIIMKDMLRQQRDFNASVILLLTDLTEEAERTQKKRP